jgi:hypothetical protein
MYTDYRLINGKPVEYAITPPPEDTSYQYPTVIRLTLDAIEEWGRIESWRQGLWFLLGFSGMAALPGSLLGAGVIIYVWSFSYATMGIALILVGSVFWLIEWSRKSIERWVVRSKIRILGPLSDGLDVEAIHPPSEFVPSHKTHVILPTEE